MHTYTHIHIYTHTCIPYIYTIFIPYIIKINNISCNTIFRCNIYIAVLRIPDLGRTNNCSPIVPLCISIYGSTTYSSKIYTTYNTEADSFGVNGYDYGPISGMKYRSKFYRTKLGNIS